jgi:hypothetical protein
MPRDDNFARARKVGALSGARAFRDSVGLRDKNDFYRFSLSRRSTFNLSLTRLKDNINVSLIQDGRAILRSAKPKRLPETVATTLAAGTYFVKVSTRRATSSYRLRLNATPVFPTVAARFLSTSAFQVGAVDPTSGGFFPLANTSTPYTDIASAQSGDLFGISQSSLYQVDPATGNTAFIGNFGTSVNMNALVFAPNNKLYAAGSDGFFLINPSTGAATRISTIPGFFSSGDLVFDAASGRFLATSREFSGSDSLYSIGLTGDAVRIGSVGFSSIWGMAYSNNVLYGYTAGRQQIVINPVTGVGTFDRLVTGTTAAIFGAT